MRHIGKLALATGSAIALAGCGGSSATTSSSATASASSNAEFVSQASAICKGINQKIAAMPAIRTMADLQKIGGREISLSIPAIAKLNNLTPPQAKTASFHRYISGMSRQMRLLKRDLSAIKAGNKGQTKKLTAQSHTLDLANNAKARKLGLPACAASVQPGSAHS